MVVNCKVVTLVRDEANQTGTKLLLELRETHYWFGKSVEIPMFFEIILSHHAALKIKEGDTLPLQKDEIMPLFRR